MKIVTENIQGLPNNNQVLGKKSRYKVRHNPKVDYDEIDALEARDREIDAMYLSREDEEEMRNVCFLGG